MSYRKCGSIPVNIGQNLPNALIVPKLKKWATKLLCTSHKMEITETPTEMEKHRKKKVKNRKHLQSS